jgi:DNA-binding response OmpR family regulator
MCQRGLRSEGVVGRRVLVVEDDDVYGRGVVRVLAEHCMTTLWTRSLLETRSRIDEIVRPGLHFAVIDDRLPDGFGLELLPLLESVEPKPAVALVTAFPTDQRAFAALRARRMLLPKPTTHAGWTELLSILDEQRDFLVATADSSSGTATAFGGFVLDETGLSTPRGHVFMRRSEIRLFAFLLECSGRASSTTEIARKVFGRRDGASTDLVRRHIANARQRLGPYGWLLELVPKKGYRLAPKAWASAHEVSELDLRG